MPLGVMTSARTGIGVTPVFDPLADAGKRTAGKISARNSESAGWLARTQPCVML